MNKKCTNIMLTSLTKVVYIQAEGGLIISLREVNRIELLESLQKHVGAL